jgi:two-component system KDP operon response regulator KdpE
LKSEKLHSALLNSISHDLLRLMIINLGKVITHSQIYQQIWNKDSSHEGIEHLLRVTVSNLRSKIEPNDEYPSLILTEPGIGYRFNIEV